MYFNLQQYSNQRRTNVEVRIFAFIVTIIALVYKGDDLPEDTYSNVLKLKNSCKRQHLYDWQVYSQSLPRPLASQVTCTTFPSWH